MRNLGKLTFILILVGIFALSYLAFTVVDVPLKLHNELSDKEEVIDSLKEANEKLTLENQELKDLNTQLDSVVSSENSEEL